MTIKPHPEIDWCETEDAKIRELYNVGWEIYDSAEQLTQIIASVGNMLREIDRIIGDPSEVRELKADAGDQKLIIYLESIEDALNTGKIAITAVEDHFRVIRNNLVEASYKKRIPTRESGSEGESA